MILPPLLPSAKMYNREDDNEKDDNVDIYNNGVYEYILDHD